MSEIIREVYRDDSRAFSADEYKTAVAGAKAAIEARYDRLAQLDELKDYFDPRQRYNHQIRGLLKDKKVKNGKNLSPEQIKPVVCDHCLQKVEEILTVSRNEGTIRHARMTYEKEFSSNANFMPDLIRVGLIGAFAEINVGDGVFRQMLDRMESTAKDKLKELDIARQRKEAAEAEAAGENAGCVGQFLPRFVRKKGPNTDDGKIKR